jgi:hypothetical protein
LSSLIKFLFHRPTWQKLPPLPRMYSVEYDVRDVDKDTSTLMRMTHTRCPQGVEILKKRHHAKTAKLLIAQLPARKRPRRIGKRLKALVRSTLGLTDYDPARTLYRQHLSETRRR